jgi:glutathione S-transferase
MTEVRLYSFELSHPALAVRAMLDRKGISYETVKVMPGMQRIHVRLAGFPGGTVPAMKLDGQRVQGSRRIARALQARKPEPSLFDTDPAASGRADDAERWGDEELQEVPRILMRWGLLGDLRLRTWLAEVSGFPAPALTARASGPTARYYARLIGADERAARETVERLPQTLARVDALLGEDVIRVESPTAATLQVLSSVRALDGFADLHDHVATHPSAAAAHSLFPDFPGPVPEFLPRAWLAAL